MILVVDYFDHTRRLISKTLQENGFQVIEAATASDALEKGKRFKPELVITELSLPDQDGFWLLKEIRQSFGKKSRIIVCSALADQQSVIKAGQFGIDDFVVKPFDEERLIASIKRVGG